MERTEIDRRFGYYNSAADVPHREEVKRRHRRIQRHFYELAVMLDSLIPESRETSLSFIQLEDSFTWAFKSIYRNREFLPPEELFIERFGEKI